MAQQIESTNRAAEKRRQAKSLIDGALNDLAGALEQGKSQTLVAYLATIARFHRYSFGNIMLIASQRPDATHVAGYRKWQQLGRQVKHGEKGILIFAPMFLKNRADESPPETSTPDEPDKLLRFRVVHVFDVSQTEGEALPEHATVNGDPAGFTDKLKRFAADSGIVVEYSAHIGSAHGYSCGGGIVLRDDLSPAETFSTLAHELAHEFLHHGEGAVRGSKTVRETEAEAVAFVVSHAIGLDTNTASSDYIQLYAGDKDTLSQSLDRIQKTASKILAAISDDEDATADV
ncbi:MAG: ImmA/IrrE family metallo-endopeptidase [Phycisphaerae bacterium]|nr:ImmA/IrrE family metallo-endopeptidase [Phycisphaerae bacterium]